MRGYFSIFLLLFLFVSMAILSGYKSESSSTGCNSPPEIVVSKPLENDNIENSPVPVEFKAIQNSTDLTSVDLSKVSAIIRDNMNKTIDISQYVKKNCDFLKKNCSFKTDVNLSEGEYILEVKVCSTAADCSIKKTRFYFTSIFSTDLKPVKCKSNVASYTDFYFSSDSLEKNIYNNYSPNTNYKMQLQINPNIKELRFNFQYLRMRGHENYNYDEYIKINDAVYKNIFISSPFQVGYFMPHNHYIYIYLYAGSNYTLAESYNNYKFKITGIEYICYETEKRQNYIPSIDTNNIRYDGFLQYDDDTFFYKVRHIEGYNTNIILSGYDNGYFEMLARRNYFPSRNKFNYSNNYANSSDQILVIPKSEKTGTFYVAVHSVNAGGQYTIRSSKVKESNIHRIIIGTDFSIDSESAMQRYADAIKKEIYIFYNLTKGQKYISKVDFYNSPVFGGTCNCEKRNCYCGDNRCDVCIKYVLPSQYYRARTINNEYVLISNQNLIIDEEEGSLAHELSHLILKLPDEYKEYDNKDRVFCGHTIMGYSSLIRGLCTQYNHCMDGQIDCGSNPPSAEWIFVGNKYGFFDILADTPDQISFYADMYYNGRGKQWRQKFFDLIEVRKHYNITGGCNINNIE